MLLVNPCDGLSALCSLHVALGYDLPISGNNVHDTVVALFSRAFPAARDSLVQFLKEDSSFWMPAVSGSGIRLLDDRDFPPALPPRPGSDIVRTFPRLTPFGVEITLPVGAIMPTRSCIEYAAYTFECSAVHPSLLRSHGTSLAWMADMIEFSLMRGGFSTIFRSFHLDHNGFRVKLFLLPQSSHMSGDALTSSVCEHPLLMRTRDMYNPASPEPWATGLCYPGTERMPYLFPCMAAISQWPDTQDLVTQREAYHARYPRVLDSVDPSPLA
jgi:hypothetical protein